MTTTDADSPAETLAGPLSPAAAARLRADLVDLVDRHAADHASTVDPQTTALAVLATARAVAALADELSTAAAAAAARVGADYPEIGRAAGMTRQGARRRWPGLAQPAAADRAARAQATRASAPSDRLSQQAEDAVVTLLMRRVAERGDFEAFLAGVTAADRAAIEDAMERHAVRQRARGEPGW
ncbi:hypothetical protein [Polymorphospora sp. NPDC050346]|uniref:hypothetical protein n=1 Tax=Polymorphospora sp. NPDC050346 TaxID=3155780 RepID=UPI0033E8187C